MRGKDARKEPRERDDSLRPFRAQNIPAYLAVLVAWVVSAGVIAALAAGRFDAKPTAVGFWVLALVSVMVGMAIMFVASLLNLAKMRVGLMRLAQGDVDPRIPPVWCPVLTAATHAVTSCAGRLRETQKAEERSMK